MTTWTGTSPFMRIYTSIRGILIFPRNVAVKKINELLSFFELTEKRDTPVDDLSGGMKRKLSVARALINDPRILIMDEPTTGLDPTARRQIWDTVIKLRAEGKTIILTTHYMDEAQELCDRIALVFGGKILEYGTPDELIGRVIGSNVCELYAPDRAKAGRGQEIDQRQH